VTRQRIAVIAGDGIGKEVMPEGVKVIEAAAARFDIDLQFTSFDWSCDNYDRIGAWMPDDWYAQLCDFDAIFFGATGWPDRVPDHVSLWDSLLKFRRDFDQYVNLRPVRLMPNVVSPLRGRQVGDIDYYVVRENTEGEYSSAGGRMYAGTEREIAIQESVFSRFGTDRIMKFAFELAQSRPRRRIASASKSNGISITMPFWDERFAAMAKHYPSVATSQYHVDAITIKMILDPGRFDVIVASNLFGDILSDLGPATAGTIGIAPSANINPARTLPSLFEPVHGSAPDIYGKRIANPIGQIWSGAMLLEHLGHAAAGRAIVDAIEAVLRDDQAPRTPDLEGTASTSDVGTAIEMMVRRSG
jgi:tartrate dehydrogenase/decarboxylase / D-malate dehydrogenase